MKAFLSLIKIQLKDKIDMSFVKSRKTLIQKIVFTVLSFAVVAAIAFLLLFILKLIGLITLGEVGNLLIVFCTIYFILDLFGTSFDLMKSLYFAEDNKLLVTYPQSAGNIFLSKIIVYFVYELRKSTKLLMPVIYGFLLNMLTTTLTIDKGATYITQITLVSLFTAIPSIIFLCILTVVLAALISVPLLYVYQFIKRRPIIELILTVAFVAGFIYLCVFLINLIPEEIILANWIKVTAAAIKQFVNVASYWAYPIRQLVYMTTGELITYGLYRLNFMFLVKFGICLVGTAALAAAVYFIIKPFYFFIMTSGSEFDNKVEVKGKANRVLNRYVTFANKELIISVRDVEISGNYIAIYIIVPILLMFIDAIYGAISKDLSGQTMTLAFNLLLILTPLLASNSMIASLYSKEGRAAYIKKTKPVNPLIPLISKLIFNLALSIPSIIACGIIFADFSDLSVLNVIMLSFAALFIQYAHILFSASLDIMRPMNEQYATDGTVQSNPNEIVSTIVGFIASIVISLLFYLLLAESARRYANFNSAFIKLFVFGLVAFASCLYLFVMKIKAFYYEK